MAQQPRPDVPTTRTWGRVAPAASDTEALPTATSDVVVVGAGITGLTAALLLRRGGADVTVLEAREPGAGTTGGTTGKVTLLQGRRVQQVRASVGDDAAADYVTRSLAAQRWVADEAEGHPGLVERRTAVTYATGRLGVRRLEHEAEALALGGVAPVWADELPELPYDVRGALTLADELQLHPVRWLEHLLAGLRRPAGPGEGRCDVRTGWRVVSVDGGAPATVTVRRDGERGGATHVVRAGRVVVATLLPFLDRGLLFARSEPTRSWCLTADVAGPLPQGMYLGIDSPSRSLRTAPDGQLLVGGESHTTGRGGPTSRRVAELDRWTREHFDARRVTAAWAAQDYTTADKLPFVGPLLPTNDRVVVASGFAKWGMTGGTAAAQQVADVLLGTTQEWPWRPWRPTVRRQVAGSAPMQAGVAWKEGTGWAGALGHRAPQTPPAEGEGVVGRRGPRVCGVSTVDGVTRSRSGVCTHLGGIVSWNDQERSWDCPLHGSRFGADGRVLDGPAVRPLSEDGCATADEPSAPVEETGQA